MNIRFLPAALLAAAIATPVLAQQTKTVAGMVVNIGIMNAIAAEHADAQHGVHKGGHGPGMEHIVVALADDKRGSRVGDAEVTIVVKNPRGAVQKKTAMAMITAGYPDYSEVFEFGWSGKYTVAVLIKRKGAAQPAQATFVVNRVQ
jgi:hypothetical protein